MSVLGARRDLSDDLARPMNLALRNLVELAWTHAMTATEQTRVTREHSLEQRVAWSHWWDRWHELEHDEPSERTLVVCVTCRRYRDGAGRWVEMPSGLSDLLASARSLCVSHGLCSACTARELHNVKHLTVSEPAGTGSMND